MLSLIERLGVELARLVPEHAVHINGAWTTSTRRTYKDPKQAGTGAGPFEEVEDARWSGRCACDVPLAGFAFLSRPHDLHWVKSSPATASPAIDVLLAGYLDFSRDRASFTGRFQGAFLPAVPVPVGADLPAACVLGSMNTATCKPHVVAEVGGNAFALLLLPQSVLELGRNHLWRLRPEVAAQLPEDLRSSLTTRRAGAIHASDPLRTA